MVAGALPPLRLLGQMLQSVVLPRLEKQVAPRFWSALRCARAATEEDPLLRLLLSTNRGPLDRLFAAYQLGGAQARAEPQGKTLTEEKFQTLLARLGIQVLKQTFLLAQPCLADVALSGLGAGPVAVQEGHQHGDLAGQVLVVRDGLAEQQRHNGQQHERERAGVPALPHDDRGPQLRRQGGAPPQHLLIILLYLPSAELT